MRPAPSYPLASVDNALRLLLLLRDRQTLRVSEVSEALSVAPSTAHRLLAMLQYYRFAEQQDESRTYVAGPALGDMGLAEVTGHDLAEQARPHLQSLSDDTGAVAHLCLLHGRTLRFVASVGREQSDSRAGVSLPAHCTSGGKALLAELPLEAVAQLYNDGRFETLTTRSIGDMVTLERHLDLVRDRGWAANVGESEREVAAVAVGVETGASGPRAAIALSTPLGGLTTRRVARLADAASRAAARVSAQVDAA